MDVGFSGVRARDLGMFEVMVTGAFIGVLQACLFHFTWYIRVLLSL